VEIRGTFQDEAVATTAVPATPPAGAPTDVTAGASGQPRSRTLRITSVRLLGGSCSGTPR
jgi:hypothetical protein